jgi:hypothetical protein
MQLVMHRSIYIDLWILVIVQVNDEDFFIPAAIINKG